MQKITIMDENLNMHEFIVPADEADVFLEQHEAHMTWGKPGTYSVTIEKSSKSSTLATRKIIDDQVKARMKIFSSYDGRVAFGAAKVPRNATVNLALDGILQGILAKGTPKPDHNAWKLYSKDDNKLYFQDGAGTEHEVSLVAK